MKKKQFYLFKVRYNSIILFCIKPLFHQYCLFASIFNGMWVCSFYQINIGNRNVKMFIICVVILSIGHLLLFMHPSYATLSFAFMSTIHNHSCNADTHKYTTFLFCTSLWLHIKVAFHFSSLFIATNSSFFLYESFWRLGVLFIFMFSSWSQTTLLNSLFKN